METARLKCCQSSPAIQCSWSPFSRCRTINGSVTNPDNSGNQEGDIAMDRSSEQSFLLPLWIWVVMAVVISYLGMPGDPLTHLLALAYSLVSFCTGAMYASSLRRFARMLPLAAWVLLMVLLACWLLSLGRVHYSAWMLLCCATVSIGMGFWACRRIKTGRLRTLSGFCAGYAAGALCGAWGFGPALGTAATALLGGLLAHRTLPASNSS